MQSVRGIAVPALVLFGILALGLLASPRGQSQQAKSIVIGAHGDQAKQASYYTLLYKDTIEVFIDELNAAGGIGGRPIKFIFEDDENNPVTAASRVEKLAAEGASYIISIGSSATGIGAQAKADEMKIPHGSPTNTAVRLSHPLRKYYFRLSLTDDLISEAMIRFIKRKFSAPRVAVVRDATETGFLISDTQIRALKDAGLNVVAVEQITPGSADVTAQALRIKEASAEVVLPSGGSIPDLANYVKAHKAIGNRALMLGNYLFTTASFGRLTGNASDGFVFVDSVYPERPEVKEIEAKLVAKKGDRFRNNLSEVHAWEYIRLIVDAVKRAGSDDRDAIRDAMEQTKNWPIAIGPPDMTLTYTPTSHDLFKAPEQAVFREYRNGQPGPSVPAG
jgi:branched-chain amino acid transport system substrate-binding protein